MTGAAFISKRSLEMNAIIVILSEAPVCPASAGRQADRQAQWPGITILFYFYMINYGHNLINPEP